MSKAWRDRQAAMHAMVGYETSGNDGVAGGTYNDGGDGPNDIGDPEMPGPRETYIPDAANHVSYQPGKVGVIRDPVDWEAGGEPGMTKFIGQFGPVESTNVDAHNLNGAMAVVRRMEDTNYGPVGAEQYTGILATLYAMQESNAYFPNEVSQADIIKAY